ncbi:MAG: glycine cleavage system aminomethyltransferase GcvT [Fimbriimonadales bacterium]|nr:glycine cleavage system aminomethyltransferase GcvT [Fimbriimonadales bacterium]
MPVILKTPLHEDHVKLGAKMVEFAGWDMPVQYAGVIAESKAVREGAGMFDVSHMGRTWFRGDRVIELLELLTTNDISKLQDGGSQYSLLCYKNGTCVDDIIVYRISDTVFRMVINASNREKDIAWIQSHNSHSVSLTDETFETAMIAVQGPKAVGIVNSLADSDISETPRFSAVEATIAGSPAFAARTGYTGEDGFELIVPADHATEVWGALLDSGVAPCGLASRDVLRVEAGLPLYGHELSDQINPIEAGLGWVVSKTKRFIGSEPINSMRAAGPPRKLVGIKMSSKIVPREGYRVMRKGREIGTVSSGVFSPMLDCGIAFAFVESSEATLDQPCEVEVREKAHPARVVSKRFMPKA